MVPILILFLYIIAVLFIFISLDRNFTFFSRQIRKASRLNVRLREKYRKDNLSIEMKNAGLPFNLYHYQLFRFVVISFSLIVIGWQFFYLHQDILLKVAVIVFLFIITIPVNKLFGFTSPFNQLINLSQKRKQEQYNEELYLAISQLKNSFLVRKDRPPSSQFVLEEVAVYTNKIRPIFNRFLSFWMLGEREKAIEYFDKEIGTKEAIKLSQVFLKLDDLNPAEMTEQLNSYQTIYRAERETKKKKKNEIKSNVLFVCVLASTLTIVVNYVVIGFFIDFIKGLNDFL